MREFREYDESEEMKRTRKQWTCEDTEDFLRRHRMITESERAEILRSIGIHPDLESEERVKVEYGEAVKVEDIDVLTEEEVLQLIERNPHVKELKGFEDMKRLSIGYLRFKEMERGGTLPDISQNELARQLGLSSSRISFYKHNKNRPKLLSILEVHESARIEQENRYSPEALEHQVKPELFHKEMRYLEPFSKWDFAISLNAVFESLDSSKRVWWVNLTPYAPVGQEWYRKINEFCIENRQELEDAVNIDLKRRRGPGLRLRIGIVESRLYLRLQEVRENDLMYLYNDEMLHFREGAREELLAKAKQSLGIKGDINLSHLVHQITDYDRSMTQQGMNTDLHHISTYLKGATLSLLLDTCGLSPQEFQDKISFIGRSDRHGIHNPKFSDDPLEIDKAFARIFGAGLSDGHIDQFRVFCYCDAVRERVEIFKGHVNFFGDVDYTETVDENGNIDVRFPAVIGRMLEKRGFTVGDKTVQNNAIPEFILYGAIEVVIEYLKQLWAEDGHFLFTEGSHPYFGWTRSVSLIDPEKDSKYKLDSDLTPEFLQFIRDNGEFIEENSYTTKNTAYPRYILTGSKLSGLTKSDETHKSVFANSLCAIITSNKSKLMVGEEKMLSRIQVESIDNCDEITYYLETGRVSALWRARTRTKDDAMRVAILAPPDDVVKRTEVLNWIQTQPKRYKRILNEIIDRNHQMSLDDYS